jgi:DNA-binding NarL/FixJ family response regulator
VIRVLVVEDHHIVRAGVVALLNMVDDFEVVGQARDGPEAMTEFRLHFPDVTLIDLRLPGTSGIDVVKDLRRESERARFVVLTAHGGDEEIYRAVQAGANAYLLKGGTQDELIRTIRSVCEGKSHFAVEIAESLARRLGAKGLTPREEEVLEKIVMGMGNRRIAETLGISESTVKVHIVNIFKKLNVTDRTQAAVAALQQGIVTLNP